MGIVDIRTGKPIAAPTFTRRKVLGGLAGILATGAAPAAFVRSAIGARTAAWSGGLSAKSYVQDGLVAMWDGIENAGWGNHNAASAQWKDLIGSNDFTVMSGGSWSEKCLVCNGTCAASRSEYEGLSAPLTVGYVFSMSNATTNNAVILHVRNWNNGRSMSRCIIVRNSVYFDVDFISDGAKNCSLPYSEFSTLRSIYLTYNGNEIIKAYLDGVETTLGNGYDTWYYSDATTNCIGDRTSGGRGTVCNVGKIQYYNRVLSSAEIAHNYAVDKARFGLT